jgi:lipopolysaccharide biosynthesis regulator YciM
MDTFIIIFLLAVIALILILLFYDRYKKDKKSGDPALYIDGLRAMLDGYEEAAFGKFRQVVAEESGNIDAYIRIGNILRKYGKPDRALQVHKDLTLRHGLSSDEKKLILKSLTLDFLDLKDVESARVTLDELLSLDGNNRWAIEKLLDIRCMTDNWGAAFETKEKLIKMDGNKSKAGLAIFKFLNGVKLFENKDYHKARLIFKEAIGMEIGCTPAYVYIGDSYLAENRLEDAVNIWKKLIGAVPDESQYVLGRLKKALFDLGKFGDISTICSEILATSPKNLDARLTLAEYYYKKGEYASTAEHLNLALEQHPESYQPILELARLYLANNDRRKLVDLIDNLQERLEAVENTYHCSRCGHKCETKKWLCPSCKAVDSFVK